MLRVTRHGLIGATILALSAPIAAQAQSGRNEPSISETTDLLLSALQKTMARERAAGRPSRLILMPVTRSLQTDSAGAEHATPWVALDSAVVTALVRSGVVAGVCEQGTERRRCGNEQRGMGVRLSQVVLPNADRLKVQVRVELEAVQGAHDRMVLVGEGRTDRWTFLHNADGWVLAAP